ncbi:ATP-binding protein [Psychromonas arctica]|uniref:histidine kinase n=1 Tax=Psychromonas arctica TaxID=168275 RepID=A0ABU9HFI9_9GAMM
MRFKWGLRSKLLTLSSLLLLLPWFAYQFVIEMENFLRLGQQQTLLGTTSAVATALHERPSLFNEDDTPIADFKKGHDLYVYDLKDPILLDGNIKDWTAIKTLNNSYSNAIHSNTTSETTQHNQDDVRFNQWLGKQGGYLYAYFEVFNPQPVKRESISSSITDNDHLIIAMSSPQGELQRYIISVAEDGWFNGYRYPQHSIYATNVTREKSIQGIWKSTPQGYNIELRLPLSLLGNKLGFQLNTSSTINSGNIDNSISTSNLLDINKLGSVLIPSPEIENILLAMSHTRSRLWVVDRQQRVIAKTGDIHQATGTWPSDYYSDGNNSTENYNGAEKNKISNGYGANKDDANNDDTNNNVSSSSRSNTDEGINEPSSFWSTIESLILSPLYDLLLDKPDNSFIDAQKNATQLDYELIDEALTGKAATQWRLNSDQKVSILSAAHPIFINGKVVGVVLAEETNHGILTLRNQALEKMFNVLIAIIFIAGILLFLFISTVVKRIRLLRDQSEHILDNNGRLNGEFKPSQHSDEIGDLSRSMADMVKRLGQYHHYVEQLSARLSHELRTPVAVVRSSLENLALLPANDEQQKYIQRSQQGIIRLNKILTSMSEASRIEQSLEQGEKQTIDLKMLINSCLQGYDMIYKQSNFIEDLGEDSLLVNADPDFLVQLLDKIIHNAVEFSSDGKAISVSLTKKDSAAVLTIENTGPLLATDQQQDLFQSMVSIRPSSQQHDTHLGLGLYIAKMICDYHQATLSIDNNHQLTGVIVTIRFPLLAL